MLNILVFPCGSEIGLEIHSALSPIKDINLFGASTVPDHGRFTYDQYCDSVDHVASDNFLTSIKAVVERFNIDYIYPAHDSVLYALSKFAGDLPCGLIAPSEEVSHICRVKSRTYKTFSDADFIPAVYQSPEDVDSYPIFAKPDVGQGSVGISIIQDKEQFSKFLDKEEPYVFCEYLPGEEFTVDCVSDAHGKLLYYGARVRARIRNGISVNTRTASAVDDEVVKIAEVLNEKK